MLLNKNLKPIWITSSHTNDTEDTYALPLLTSVSAIDSNHLNNKQQHHIQLTKIISAYLIEHSRKILILQYLASLRGKPKYTAFSA